MRNWPEEDSTSTYNIHRSRLRVIQSSCWRGYVGNDPDIKVAQFSSSRLSIQDREGPQAAAGHTEARVSVQKE